MSDTIRAKQFIVVDDEGRERAKFGASDKSVELTVGSGNGPNVALTVQDNGKTGLEFRSGSRMIRLLIDGHRAQIKLKDHDAPESSCGFTLDGAGAWVNAEATPDIGVRMLSNRKGDGAVVWLSEKRIEEGDPIVKTRYLHPDPTEDVTGGWRVDP